MSKKIAVVGCPRSGTLYTQKVFGDMDVLVGHEKWGREGIVSWFNTSNVLKCNYTLYTCMENNARDKSELEDLIIVHQVREPLACIGSMHTLRDISWGYIRKHLGMSFEGDSLCVKCMKMWYHWNKLAESIGNMTYRVENIGSSWIDIARLIGANPKFTSQVPVGAHSRKHVEMSWDILSKASPELCKDIMELSKTYGY